MRYLQKIENTNRGVIHRLKNSHINCIELFMENVEGAKFLSCKTLMINGRKIFREFHTNQINAQIKAIPND